MLVAVGKPKANRPLGRPRPRWNRLIELGWRDWIKIRLAYDVVKWRVA
jgi:hypothetical protein